MDVVVIEHCLRRAEQVIVTDILRCLAVLTNTLVRVFEIANRCFQVACIIVVGWVRD